MEAGAEQSSRGTSLDAWESRKLATGTGPDTEKYKNEYLAASFSDAISIYLLSLFIDVDYYDLRERDYPLLAPSQMAERLKKVAELFPANPGLNSRFSTREKLSHGPNGSFKSKPGKAIRQGAGSSRPL